ncbi:MAG: 16S rRNA (guanine(527)-N(7))-methyltransferase RsmG [Alphaproteobacteria bacterium]|nr:MAG: 16S rRNA (guanine(527)-N(7))-methyltransferase RsmG [Alphaproteobacteria bacterium]
MDETAAREALNVPRETLERLEAFVALLREENERQNLVSRATLEQVWVRHLYDSAQLLRFAPEGASTWLDLGSGAGFPGLIVAALRPEGTTTLVESRKLRVDFLKRGAEVLGVTDRVEVVPTSLQAMPAHPFDVISARAFAPLDKLLTLAERFSQPETIWILPKGRNAKSELDAARASWQGVFRLEASLTDSDAMIIVASGVRRIIRGKKGR